MSNDGNEKHFEVVCGSDEPEWLGMRRTGIGASESPGVLCVSNWMTPLSIYAEKISEGENDLVKSEVMAAGNRLEPHIAEWCLELMNDDGEAGEGRRQIGQPYGQLIRSIKYPWMLCTPDWLTWTRKPVTTQAWTRKFEGGSSPPVPFQIKNTMRASDWDDGVPENVLIQCIHEAIVFGADHCYVGVLLTGNRPRWARIDLCDHEELCEKIIEDTQHLWDQIERRVPAWEVKLDGSQHTHKALFRLHPKDNGETVELSGLMMEKALIYDELKLQEKEAKRAAERIAAQMKAEIGDNTFAVFPDGSGFSWKHHEREEHVVKASEFRTLRRSKSKRAAKQ